LKSACVLLPTLRSSLHPQVHYNAPGCFCAPQKLGDRALTLGVCLTLATRHKWVNRETVFIAAETILPAVAALNPLPVNVRDFLHHRPRFSSTVAFAAASILSVNESRFAIPRYF